MTQGAKKTEETQAESGDIDRIIQEIEEMEKSLDSTPQTADATDEAVASESLEESGSEESNNVVALKARQADAEAHTSVDSPVSSGGALDTFDQALKEATARGEDSRNAALRASSDRGSPAVGRSTGDLSLAVSGCSSITLDFSRAGIQVTLSCDEEGLCISTDNGAEFRVPFRRAA
jgi:hypothetical protein